MEIINTEVKTAANGNSYKQVTIAQKMFGDKDRVNVFQDHPMYNESVVGFDIPEDKLYINQRGYLELKNDAPKKTPQAAPANISEMAIKTAIAQEIAPVKEALRAIVAHLGIEAPKPTVGNTDIEYPQSGTSDGNGEITPTEEIKPEDIPF